MVTSVAFMVLQLFVYNAHIKWDYYFVRNSVFKYTGYNIASLIYYRMFINTLYEV